MGESEQFAIIFKCRLVEDKGAAAVIRRDEQAAVLVSEIVSAYSL